MKLSAINNYKSFFFDYLAKVVSSSSQRYEPGFSRNVIYSWQENFSMDSIEFSKSFAQSLMNIHSGRLWGGEKYSIKSEMVNLIKCNPLLMGIAFTDLFDESKDISMRINRFLFHCDQVLVELKKKDERMNDHRQSVYSASLFLSLQYPEKYGLYQFDSFYRFMELVESRNIPTEQEIDRYFKSLNALYTVISKDTDFMNGVSYLLKDYKYQGKSLFLINEFIDFSLNRGH